MSYIGSTKIGGLYLGSTKIAKAYLGGALVYQSNHQPQPYTPLSYIQTDGDAYINTGIKANVPLSVELKVVMKRAGSGNMYMMGARGSATNNRIAPLVVNSNNNAGAYYYGSLFTTKSISSSLSNSTPFEVRFSAKAGAIMVESKADGEESFTRKTGTTSQAVTSNIDMFLFCYNVDGTPNTRRNGERLYYCKIYGDETFSHLVFNGIPCLYNGEYGLWDLVTNTFFGNASSTGAFTGA